MPAGYQFWDATGQIIVDTTTSVLRELVATVVSASSTAEQSIAIPPTGPATMIPQVSSPALPGEGTGEVLTTRLEGGVLKYKFYATSGADAELRVLAF